MNKEILEEFEQYVDDVFQPLIDGNRKKIKSQRKQGYLLLRDNIILMTRGEVEQAIVQEREHNNDWHKQSTLRDLKYLKNCAIGNLFPLYTKEERGECVAKRIDEIVERIKE